MNYRIYENIKSKRQVYVLKKNKKYVRVEYVTSGQKCWYLVEDFNRLFNLISQ
ncbi:MAG: hypothetical protein HMLIMOIP_002579 [Candidatus Nitrosomirales archaeon]|jgi:hypothetical protein